MENTKTNYQYLHTDGNWYPIEIKKCNMTKARGTINQGRPYQPVYIKDGKEYPIRYRRPTVESAFAELQAVVEHGDGTCNGKRYRLFRSMADNSQGLHPLRLFVYGTLKRGYENHHRFCKGVASIEDAVVRGRLYELPSGIPVLEVPQEDVLAIGTNNPIRDAAVQHTSTGASPASADLGNWDTVQGELITLSEPNTALPPIDRLEGFAPPEHCLYRRVLLKVVTNNNSSMLAWCYVGTSLILCHSSPTGRSAWPC